LLLSRVMLTVKVTVPVFSGWRWSTAMTGIWNEECAMIALYHTILCTPICSSNHKPQIVQCDHPTIACIGSANRVKAISDHWPQVMMDHARIWPVQYNFCTVAITLWIAPYACCNDVTS
jgi:hypothetical protein